MYEFRGYDTGTAGSTGLLILRLVAGSALMLHGLQKIQNPFAWMGPESWAPPFLQALGALGEFGGGLGLLLGLLTPISCLGVLAVMLTAMATVHGPAGDPFVGKGSSHEPAALYAAISLCLILVGPGKYSLDALLFKGRRFLSFGRPAEPLPVERPDLTVSGPRK